MKEKIKRKITEQERISRNEGSKLYMRNKRENKPIQHIKTQIKYWTNKLESTLLEMEV